MRMYLGLAAAVVLAFAGLVQAGPLNMKQVSAEAKWAAHLDVDALMASTLVRKPRELILQMHPELEGHLSMLRNLWRFDPMTDLHGITIYGTQLKKDTGVAVIHAKVDQKMVLELVKTTPEHKVTPYGKFELHSWRKDAEKTENAAFFKPDVIVFGASADELKAALDVLDGTKPSFPVEGEALASLIPPGTILFAGAKDLAEANLHPESPLSKQADSALVVIGENSGQIFVRATLNVNDPEIAKRIKTVAEGALALAALAKCDDADALKLIDAVKVTLADKTITAEGSTPVDLLWAQIHKEIVKKLGPM
jgi:hypothetical protein